MYSAAIAKGFFAQSPPVPITNSSLAFPKHKLTVQIQRVLLPNPTPPDSYFVCADLLIKDCKDATDVEFGIYWESSLELKASRLVFIVRIAPTIGSTAILMLWLSVNDIGERKSKVPKLWLLVQQPQAMAANYGMQLLQLQCPSAPKFLSSPPLTNIWHPCIKSRSLCGTPRKLLQFRLKSCFRTIHYHHPLS